MTTASHKSPFQIFLGAFKPFQQFKPFESSNAFEKLVLGAILVALVDATFYFVRCRRVGLFPVLLAYGLTACSASPKIVLQYGGEYTRADLAKVLVENPLGAGENVRLTTLGQDAAASQHIVQIRDREIPHTHNHHDSTVLMMRGHGYLIMDGRRTDLSVGDIVHIPRAVPHYYVNAASEPTVAFVVFAPAFDGKDNVPVTAP